MEITEQHLILTHDMVKEARKKGQKVNLKWKGENIEPSGIMTKDGLGRMQKVKRRISLTIDID